MNPTTLWLAGSRSPHRKLGRHYVPILSHSPRQGRALRIHTSACHNTHSACNATAPVVFQASRHRPPSNTHTPHHPLLTLDALDRPLLTPPSKPCPITTTTPTAPQLHAARSGVLLCCTRTRSLKEEGTIGGRSRAEPTFAREGYGRLDRDEHREDGGGR